MTKIIHNPGEYEFIGYSSNSGILITDLNGSFTYLQNNNDSKFNGIFYYDLDSKNMIKIISSIKINDGCDEIQIKDTNFSINNLELNYISNSTLQIKPQKLEEITINFDVREIYDFSEWNKSYEIKKEDENNIVISYNKNKFNFFIKIYSENINFEKIENWEKEIYSKDQERNSPPFEFYTFKGLKIISQEPIIISYSKSLEETNIKLNDALKNTNNHEEINNIKDTRINHAYKLAKKSLNFLKIEEEDFEGYFAGLPWFFQFWTRDEAISLSALIQDNKYEEVKKILNRQLTQILPNGRNPNRFPHSELGSADGIGLTISRYLELLKKLEKEKKIQKYFTKIELTILKNKIDSIINKIKINFEQELLIKNYEKETWMDTNETKLERKDNRDGFCIEIQAYYINMLYLQELLEKITKQGIKPKIKPTLRKIQDEFLNNSIIQDRLNFDFTKTNETRPNIFLAYYFCNSIFSNKIWEKTFDNALEKLWLDWGGFSTINKDSEIYCDTYTGQNNFSYHRGDSWFFINNIAAISMYNLNKEKYQEHINKIIESSTTDILFNGIVGHCSEISDAKELTAKASLSQLWSIATYIEMIKKINY